MALELQSQHTVWTRTLPNPANLTPNGDLRRSSSLLQHHISSNQFQTPAADENSRRGTIPCLPSTVTDVAPSLTQDIYTKQRQDAFMSGEEAIDLSSEGTSPSGSTSYWCLCIPDPKIPRPRNAFILYRQNQHAEVVRANPGLPNPEVSKIIGEQWQRLPLEEKDRWKAFAEEEKARHSQQFPDYRYRPKRSVKQSGEDLNQAPVPAKSCDKCGGKIMNPPHTPHYPPIDHHQPSTTMSRPQKRPYGETHIQPRAPSMVQVAPHHMQPPMRYAYQSRHDSVPYPAPPPHHLRHDTAEAKRRRVESSYSARPSYDHQYYDRERHMYPHPQSVTRPPMPQPAIQRPSHPPPPSATSRPSVTGPPRRDPSLTLPPLKTGVPPRSALPEAPKTSTEAVIMSYPILPKLKTLHSIAPLLATPTLAASSNEARGAIIAIEGLDQRRVLDMTNSLFEQLEKEGKFLVRIFTGPNPYEGLQSSRRASERQDGEYMTPEKYLALISDWHQVSKDMVDFISHDHINGEKFSKGQDEDMPDASAVENHKMKSPFRREAAARSPIEEVSPMSIQKPQATTMDIETSTLQEREENLLRITRSRVPNTVQNQAKANGEDTTATSAVSSTSPERSAVPSTPIMSPNASNGKDHTRLIPIALVPHYQLTTVDTCAMALPIFDKYDPFTHWRWHATLWRGCVGPDVSIVINSSGQQHDEKKLDTQPRHGSLGTVARSAEGGPPSGVPPGTAPPVAAPAPVTTASPFGVEVRLQDHRAVIVRATGTNPKSSDTTEKDIEKGNENWEKAKRRVGFEVEEWMRR